LVGTYRRATKNYEKYVAGILGSERAPYKNREDVVHPDLFVRCHCRKSSVFMNEWININKWASKEDKIPLLFFRRFRSGWDDGCVVMPFKLFECIKDDFLRCVKYGEGKRFKEEERDRQKQSDSESTEVSRQNEDDRERSGELFRI
jgi:hypothetical protein